MNTLEDVRLPLCEVLHCAGVRWSGRAVSRRFRNELEASRDKLRIRWGQVESEYKLQKMLSRLTNLRSLDGSGCPRRYLESLVLPQLRELVLYDCRRVQNLGPLVVCTALRTLALGGCEMLTDLSAVRACPLLMSLDVSGCNSLIDISPMSALRSLEQLDMSHCAGVRDIGGLASCTALVGLN